MFIIYLSVFIGSGIGGLLRYLASEFIVVESAGSFPLATLFVNVTGSFIIGFIAAITAPDGKLPAADISRQFMMVGICGGYTTFSSFSLQTLNLFRNGEVFKAGLNIGASVILCMVAVWAGYALARMVSNN